MEFCFLSKEIVAKASIHRFLCSSNFGYLKCLFFIAALVVYKAFMFNFSHIQINKIKIAIK
jgi:hypothetical protein